MPFMNNQNADRLVKEYADTILRISYMYLKQTCDAEDICQDVFLKLLTMDLTFTSPTHERAWIIRTTVNICKDRLRTGFWKRSVDLELAAEIPSPEAPQSELLDQVMSLPKNYRISIFLRYYEEYSVKEIASILGKPENTVSAWLMRGRRKLKNALEAENAGFHEGELKGGNHHVGSF